MRFDLHVGLLEMYGVRGDDGNFSAKKCAVMCFMKFGDSGEMWLTLGWWSKQMCLCSGWGSGSEQQGALKRSWACPGGSEGCGPVLGDLTDTWMCVSLFSLATTKYPRLGALQRKEGYLAHDCRAESPRLGSHVHVGSGEGLMTTMTGKDHMVTRRGQSCSFYNNPFSGVS